MAETNTIDDGGPAFPVVHAIVPQPGHFTNIPDAIPGMSLRDFFAAKAMQGMIARIAADRWVSTRYDAALINMSRMAYITADAMLEAKGAA